MKITIGTEGAAAMQMDAKTAVKAAKAYLADLLDEESPVDVGLEELEHDDNDGVWLVTLGFSRPWNTVRNSFTAIAGEVPQKRAYRVLSVRDSDGEVLSFKRREGAD